MLITRIPQKVIKISMKKNLVFHGTSLPVWTPSTELKPPTFDRPLFVTDRPNIASSYIMAKSGSIFIFNLKENPRTISFDFSNPSHLSKLGERLPLTANFIMKVQKRRKSDGFFVASRYLEIAANGIKGVDPCNLENDSVLEKCNVLKELGLAVETPSGEFSLTPELMDVTRKTGFDRVGTPGRRLIKSKVYKVIYDMGYKIAMDADSSLYGSTTAKEFALFDLGLIVDGANASVNPAEAMRYTKKLYG